MFPKNSPRENSERRRSRTADNFKFFFGGIQSKNSQSEYNQMINYLEINEKKKPARGRDDVAGGSRSAQSFLLGAVQAVSKRTHPLASLASTLHFFRVLLGVVRDVSARTLDELGAVLLAREPLWHRGRVQAVELNALRELLDHEALEAFVIFARRNPFSRLLEHGDVSPPGLLVLLAILLARANFVIEGLFGFYLHPCVAPLLDFRKTLFGRLDCIEVVVAWAELVGDGRVGGFVAHLDESTECSGAPHRELLERHLLPVVQVSGVSCRHLLLLSFRSVCVDFQWENGTIPLSRTGHYSCYEYSISARISQGQQKSGIFAVFHLLTSWIKKFSSPKIKIWFEPMFFSGFFYGFERCGSPPAPRLRRAGAAFPNFRGRISSSATAVGTKCVRTIFRILHHVGKVKEFWFASLRSATNLYSILGVKTNWRFRISGEENFLILNF